MLEVNATPSPAEIEDDYDDHYDVMDSYEYDGELPDDDEFADGEGYAAPVGLAWSPEEFWFLPDGGLTAEAQDFLGSMDRKGEFV